MKSREANAITLEWTEPKCRYSDGIKSYNIALTSAWDGLFGDQEEFEVVVIPGCLERLSDRRVSVTLNETMCNAQSVMFRSCSPYQFTVLPEFVVASANENVEGWSQGTSTNPLDKDLGVNLAVEDKGSRWFLLSWDQPKCRSPVTMWTLLDNFLNQSISIPPDCPLQENNLENETSRKLLLNVSDTLACDQNAQGLPILPCSWHGFTLKVELNKIDGIFSTENGTTSASSLSEGK